MLLFWLACSGDAPTEDDTAASFPDTNSCFFIAPHAVDFGELNVLEGETDSAVLTLVNTCSTPVTLDALALEGDTDAFTLTGVSQETLAVDGQVDFSVSFVPTGIAENIGTIVAESSLGRSTTDLSGFGLAPDIAITPQEHDFGAIPVGCVVNELITIANTGWDDLSIDDVSLTGSSGQLELFENVDAYGALPWSLPPQESVVVAVRFAPDAVGDDSATLTVTSNALGASSATATQAGTGVAPAAHSDTFTALGPAIDLLIAVNRIASMNSHIDRFQEALPVLLQGLAVAEVDYRIAIIVQDSGEVVGDVAYLHPDNANDASVIVEDMLDAEPGEYAEMGFHLLLRGVEQGGDWLRPEVGLHLLSISDVPDDSPSEYYSYISIYQGYRDAEDDVTVHAIGGDYPGGCDGIEPYTGFYEATVYTGGLFQSICTDNWALLMPGLVAATYPDYPSYTLTADVDPATITVTVDGEETGNWLFSGSDNSITFDADAQPEAGATITVDYDERPDCP